MLNSIQTINHLQLNSRDDYSAVLRSLLKPIENLYNPNESTITMSDEIEVSYGKDISRFEAFSRSLLGWSFLKNNESKTNIFFSMIKNGVNVNHQAYWGKIYNNDQKIVELFPILLFCVVNKEKFNKYYSFEEKKKISDWFNQINKVTVPVNNWQFFVVLVNTFLRCLSLDYSKEKMNEAIGNIEKLYLENGWYKDGNCNQRDYYIAFAFHFYSLLFVLYYPTHKQSNLYISRAHLFARQYQYFFSKEGSCVAFGRSLTYKFAPIAFWAIYSIFVSDINKLSEIKGIINRNLRWWFKQDIFDSNGFLVQGYAYSNFFMTEYYNAKGSSYWCLKAFAMLLNHSNEFFFVKESDYVNCEIKKYIPSVFSVLCAHNGHSYLFMNGQNSENEFCHIESKYEKFLYTSICAFSVSRSLYGIENIGCDNTIVVKAGNTLLVRKNVKPYVNNQDIQVSEWNALESLKIKSYILPGAPYHYRIHVVKTTQEIDLLDFGTSIQLCKNTKITTKNNIAECYVGGQQYCRAFSIGESGIAKVCKSSPNINLQYPRVVIPYIETTLRKGTHYIINCFYNDIVSDNYIFPQIYIKDNKIQLGDFIYKLEEPAHKNKSIYTNFIKAVKQFKYIIKNI